MWESTSDIERCFVAWLQRKTLWLRHSGSSLIKINKMVEIKKKKRKKWKLSNADNDLVTNSYTGPIKIR